MRLSSAQDGRKEPERNSTTAGAATDRAESVHGHGRAWARRLWHQAGEAEGRPERKQGTGERTGTAPFAINPFVPLPGDGHMAGGRSALALAPIYRRAGPAASAPATAEILSHPLVPAPFPPGRAGEGCSHLHPTSHSPAELTDSAAAGMSRPSSRAAQSTGETRGSSMAGLGETRRNRAPPYTSERTLPRPRRRRGTYRTGRALGAERRCPRPSGNARGPAPHSSRDTEGLRAAR